MARCQSCGWTQPAPMSPCPVCGRDFAGTGRREGFVAQLLKGAGYPLRGLVMFLKHPRLVPPALVPMLVNVVLLSALTVLFLVHGRGMLEYTPEWGWLNWPLLLVYYPIYGVVWGIYALIDIAWLAWLGYLLWCALVGVLFVFVGPLVAWPLSEPLAGRAEVLLLGKRVEGKREKQSLVWSTLRALLEMSMVLVLSVGCLVLHLIPVIGSLVYFVAAAWWLSFDCLCLSMIPRDYGLGEKISLLNANLGKVIGFGVVSGFLISVPVLNLVILPVVIVGGTILYVELDRK